MHKTAGLQDSPKSNFHARDILFHSLSVIILPDCTVLGVLFFWELFNTFLMTCEGGLTVTMSEQVN